MILQNEAKFAKPYLWRMSLSSNSLRRVSDSAKFGFVLENEAKLLVLFGWRDLCEAPGFGGFALGLVVESLAIQNFGQLAVNLGLMRIEAGALCHSSARLGIGNGEANRICFVPAPKLEFKLR
jgi:hypothetical protein